MKTTDFYLDKFHILHVDDEAIRAAESYVFPGEIAQVYPVLLNY